MSACVSPRLSASAEKQSSRCRREKDRGKVLPLRSPFSATLEYLIRWIASERSGIREVQSVTDIHAAGHRVVHGGELFAESVLITDEVLKGIEDCIDLAPLHNPNNIKGILCCAANLWSQTAPSCGV